ncbi:hypothetical protein THAOC_32745, partial [Thalassiosira oceanica]
MSTINVNGKRSREPRTFTCASCGRVDDVDGETSDFDVLSGSIGSRWASVQCTQCGQVNLLCNRCPYKAVKKRLMSRHWMRAHKPASAPEPQISPSAAAARSSDDDEDVTDSAGGDWIDAEIPVDMEGGDLDDSENDDQSAQEADDEPATSGPGQTDQPDASGPGQTDQPDANLVDESEVDLDNFQINVALENLQPSPRSIMNDLPAIKPLPEGVLPIHAFPDVGRREKNSIFFYQEYLGRSLHGRSGGGMQGSAWRALHKVNSHDAEDILDPRDADFLFETMEHALDSKGQQRENFFSILSRMYERVPKTMTDFINLLAPEQKQRFIDFQAKLEANEELSGLYDGLSKMSNDSVKVPSTPAEADALLLRGRNSLYGQLPDLTVHTDGAGNAYIKLMDLIAMVVAMGVPISYIQDENGVVGDDHDDFNPINGCKAARDIMERLRE